MHKYLIAPCVIAFCVTMLCFSGFAAEAKYDEPPPLKSTDDKEGKSFDKFDEILDKANAVRSADATKFAQYLIELEKNIDQLKKEQLDYYLYLKTYQIAFNGNLPKAIVNLENLINSNAKELLKTRAKITLINLYSFEKKWQQSFVYVSEIVERLETITDQDTREHAMLSFSTFYNWLSQYELSLQYSEQVLAFSLSGRRLCHTLQLNIEAYFGLNRFDAAEKKIANGLDICEREQEFVAASFIRTNYANYLLNNNLYDRVLELLLPYLKTVENTNYNILISEYYATIAKSFFYVNDYNSAESFATKVINLTPTIEAFRPNAVAYQVLFQIHEARGNHKLASEYKTKYYETDRAYLNEVNVRNLAYELARHEVREKNNRIQVLNRKNEVLRLEQSLVREDSANKQLTILILILVISFFGLWIYRNKKTHDKLRQLAEYDSLTGINNRQHFTKMAVQSLKNCKAANQSASYILFDLDKFKSINDSFGHPAGDWTLSRVPKEVKKVIRKADLFGRLGGEEFAIVLPGCELDKARQIAEEIRGLFAAIETIDSGYDFKITASFGVTVSRVSGYDFDILMKDADDAMYEAKRNGRNQICVHSIESSEYITEHSTTS